MFVASLDLEIKLKKTTQHYSCTLQDLFACWFLETKMRTYGSKFHLWELANATLGNTLGIALSSKGSQETCNGDVFAHIALDQVCCRGSTRCRQSCRPLHRPLKEGCLVACQVSSNTCSKFLFLGFHWNAHHAQEIIIHNPLSGDEARNLYEYWLDVLRIMFWD